MTFLLPFLSHSLVFISICQVQLTRVPAPGKMISEASCARQLAGASPLEKHEQAPAGAGCQPSPNHLPQGALQHPSMVTEDILHAGERLTAF